MTEAGSREARFTRLYELHLDAVRAYAWRRSQGLADEIVAETFLVAWRRLEAIPEDALPWLIGVARNVRANLRRGDRRR
jgi:RNA polymerase sigma-70 factor, ECF subfamily